MHFLSYNPLSIQECWNVYWNVWTISSMQRVPNLETLEILRFLSRRRSIWCILPYVFLEFDRPCRIRIKGKLREEQYIPRTSTLKALLVSSLWNGNSLQAEQLKSRTCSSWRTTVSKRDSVFMVWFSSFPTLKAFYTNQYWFMHRYFPE